jgi:EAL domain-containing protein (putative c-di-GMP-specific phosphodiesterase class I)
MRSKLSINFLPNAIYKPEVCIRTTLASASKFDFAVDRIIFETVEGERINDAVWLAEIFKEYRRQGFKTAIDDFGAGFAGLALLADFQPDIIKLDMALVRGIDANWPRQSIVRGILSICRDLNIDVIAEGVETDLECKCLQDLGVRLMQGYLFSKPIFKGCVLDSTTLAWPTRP